MRKRFSYGILIIGLSLGLAMCAGVAEAQRTPTGLTQVDLYCSGLVTDQPVPQDTYLISGENSSYKTAFVPGDAVYINRGADQGVKIGDEFQVVRAVHNSLPGKWFKYQPQLRQAMGTTYADIGRLRVLHVQPKTSTAELTMSCDFMQRGDIVLPFQPRPSPAFHNVKFDPFAPPSGKKTAMIVTAKNFEVVAGMGSIVYVNLGSAQGVQVGDYFRVFRYQGDRNETLYKQRDTAYKVYGFGSTPVAYQWNDLPRQVMGEGIVLRTGPNSSTVLLTTSRDAMYIGDYVELE
jgi:Flagellar assembly protein T, C-terminal domain